MRCTKVTADFAESSQDWSCFNRKSPYRNSAPSLAGLFVFRFLVACHHVAPSARDATRIPGKGTLRGKSVDLIEAFVGLIAFIVLLACLGKMGDALGALEKRERDH